MKDGAAGDRTSALDELYAATPDEFVLVRSRLERELKAAGDAEAATEIHRRRRPHLAAWASNQLARQEPGAIADLLDITGRVANAQADVVRGGDADALRELARERQDLLEELTAAAVQLLRGLAPKPDSYRDNIASTLDAASLDPTLAVELQGGRITQVLSAPSGFGPAPTGAASAAPPKARDTRRAREAAEREAAAARTRAQQLGEALDEARAEQASAQIEAESAASHARDVEQALERAQSSLEQANASARRAQERVETMSREAATATADVHEAEARVRQLGDA